MVPLFFLAYHNHIFSHKSQLDAMIIMSHILLFNLVYIWHSCIVKAFDFLFSCAYYCTIYYICHSF